MYAAMGFLVENLVDSRKYLTSRESGVVIGMVLLHFFMPLLLEVLVAMLVCLSVGVCGCVCSIFAHLVR